MRKRNIMNDKMVLKWNGIKNNTIHKKRDNSKKGL